MKYLTVIEAAEYTGRTVKAIQRLLEKGRLPYEKREDFRRVIPQDALDEFVVTQTTADSYARASTLLEEIPDPEGEDTLSRQVALLRKENKKLNAQLEKERDKYAWKNLWLEGLKDIPPYRPELTISPRKKAASTDNPHEMLLLVSDAHYGEYVDPSSMLGGWYYDIDVCRQRMEAIVEKTLSRKSRRDSAYDINKLTIAVLGDMLSGEIHDEIKTTNQINMVRQMQGMSALLTDMGLAFVSEGIEVEMIIIFGNHPRLTKEPANKDKINNMDFVTGLMVEQMARDRFKVIVPESIIYVHEILGHRIGFTHGDGFRANGYAGIPFSALDRRRNLIQALCKDYGLPSIDMLMMGHFHTYTHWPGGGCDIVINGSIKGPDEYAFNQFYKGEQPRQVLLTLDQVHGINTIEFIDLGHIGRIQNG